MLPSEPFSSRHFEAARRPLLEATTLPTWCYSAPEFYAREVDRIFLRTWHYVGREDELPNTGDYLTFDGHGGPVVLTRDGKNELHAFYNVCRHRGTPLVQGAGCVQRLICPYHSWTYGLDGELLRASGMTDTRDFHLHQHNLLPVRLETWEGFLFICYSNDTPSLKDYLGDMPAFFAAYQPQALRVVKRFEFDIASNWKLVMENALEAYHTGTVHKDTLGRQESRHVTTSGQWDAQYIYVRSDETSVATLRGTAPALPHIEGLTGDQKKGTYFTDIYPCTQFVFAQDCMWWLSFKPISVEQTHLTLGACFPKSTIALPNFEDAVKDYYHRWQSATPEDNAIAEAQQRGLAASDRPPGRFSKEEASVHRLANWVLDRVLD